MAEYQLLLFLLELQLPAREITREIIRSVE